MKRTRYMICIVLLVMAVTVVGAESEKTDLRTWTTQTGQTVDAAFEKIQYNCDRLCEDTLQNKGTAMAVAAGLAMRSI